MRGSAVALDGVENRGKVGIGQREPKYIGKGHGDNGSRDGSTENVLPAFAELALQGPFIVDLRKRVTCEKAPDDAGAFRPGFGLNQ
jgi:hypothetical protein